MTPLPKGNILKTPLLRSLLICGAFFCASPSFSQSAPLGLNYAETELSYGKTAATGGPIGRITGDFRITDALGIQFDLSATSYPDGALGQIDAHLYLMPRETIKYGLFLALADVDGREATIGSIGAEMIADVSDTTQIAAEAEIGIVTSLLSGKRRNMDFIAATLGVSHDFNAATTAYATLTATEFDEALLRAIAYGVRVGVHCDIPGQPIRISAAVGYDKMAGRDARKGEAVAQISLTWRFGAGGNTLASRSFGRARPLDQLLRRGLF